MLFKMRKLQSKILYVSAPGSPHYVIVLPPLYPYSERKSKIKEFNSKDYDLLNFGDIFFFLRVMIIGMGTGEICE